MFFYKQVNRCFRKGNPAGQIFRQFHKCHDGPEKPSDVCNADSYER